MNTFSLRTALVACVSSLFSLCAIAAPTPGGGGTTAAAVTYAPAAKIVQGNQPLAESYQLSITSPSNLTAGTSVTVTLAGSVLSKPTGVDDAVALSFLSFSTDTITFTGPSQTVNVTVSVDVPLGEFSGNYAYRIMPSGWPTTLTIVDEGATVNALVSPPAASDTSTPSVVLNTPAPGTVYTYYPVEGTPVTVPITFDATVGTGGQPITGLQALVNGTGVTVTPTGIGTLAASGTASIDLTEAGTYAVRVTATNQNGTAEDNGDFSVVISAPPPTISVSTPADNASYTFPTGEAGASVPVSYTATSQYGNITATGATLNGAPITLNLDGVGTALVATGSTTLTVPTPGSYVLQFTASNDYGDATPVTVNFTVESVDPIPTATILTPADGTVFDRTEGDPDTVVEYTFSGGTDFGMVESVTVTVDGVEVTPTTVDGIGTTAVTGSGSLSYGAAGDHTISVTVSNGFSTATDSTTFTVDEASADICANITWLPPISLNKTIEGGSCMPIKFRLDCNCRFVRDETVLISIYEIHDDGSMSEPVIYPYGTGSPNPPDYAITGHMYHLNFDTADGVHHYRIEVYRPRNADGTSLQLLGTKDLLTKEGSKCDKSGKSGKSYKSCKSDKSNKWGKSCKSDKSSKDCDKSSKDYSYHKSDKSDKDCDKSGKDYSYGKSDKSGKSSYSSSSSSSWSSWCSWGSWGWSW